MLTVVKSRNGFACLPIGGGAVGNTFRGRIVLDYKDRIKRAVYVRPNIGPRDQVNQAVVPLDLDDLVIEVSGFLPADPKRSMRSTAYVIMAFEPHQNFALINVVQEFVEPELNLLSQEFWSTLNKPPSVDSVCAFISNIESMRKRIA